SEPEAWTTVAGTQATVTNSEDSAHVLKWQCVDALGNTETVHTEYDIVDTQAPTFEKSLIGPYSGACLPQNENDVCFVDGVTKIHVVSTDEGPHPSDHVTCDWDYTVVGGTKIGTGQTGVTPPFDINFPEESEHTLTVTCKDVLGNSVTDVEKFVVDKTAPTTTNTYGTPLVTTAGGYPKWITSQTAVTLAVDDTGVHKSGIKETKYRVTLLGSDAPCQNDELCQQQTGSGEFSAYSNAFTIGQESCHLIEFYSVDNVQKTETTKKQCVFVENTAPQSSKSLTGQQHACGTGENLGIADCSYITQATDVTLTCSDNGNHPVDQVKIEYKVDWKQDSGDTWTEGILQEAGSQVTFKYTKDSYHKLTWYCVDALNNAEAQHVELDIVDTQAPVSQKILGTPQHACNATEQSAYYPEMASPTAGCNFITKQTSITINCADQIPHPVGGETIKYKYYLLGSEPEAWTTGPRTRRSSTR
ncbi:MAG: hypothetical protein NT016_04270, partial [Candidatus Aenigmarchaeota archaeon]|nr:hypothetical protein [Candidatus Aenigmarchaeota archaeon]